MSAMPGDGDDGDYVTWTDFDGVTHRLVRRHYLGRMKKHDREGLVHLVTHNFDRWPLCTQTTYGWTEPGDYRLEISFDLFATEEPLTCLRCHGLAK